MNIKKFFSILIIIIFGQFQILNAIAGSDGQIEISSKKIVKMLKIVLKVLIEQFLLSTKD